LNDRSEEFLSIDVESIATGYTHEDRHPVTVSVVNIKGDVIYEGIIKPSIPVVSYLTILTGLKKGDLDNGESMEIVLENVSWQI
ncbi:unnamed protein product, partial [Didymodactylos carnosus]